jgi:serine/threonine-protein kinase
VLDVLEEAHTLGIIHRDLKPANIMLSWEQSTPRIKVLDFGLAQVMDTPGEPRITVAGMAHGTPAYMSPEQCRGEVPDGRSDLYSLGCMLFELICGQTPFGNSPAAEVMSGHLYRPPPLLRHLRPDLHVPPALETLVLDCLSKVKQQRPENAQVMRLRLHQSLAPIPSSHLLRGEGKKKDRSRSAAHSSNTEVPTHLPVGVLEPKGNHPPSGLSTALGALGFRVTPFAEGDRIDELDALIVVSAPGHNAMNLACKLAARPQAPPVLLCGEDDLRLMTRAIEGGLYDYIPLPLDPAELNRKVARALRARR